MEHVYAKLDVTRRMGNFVEVEQVRAFRVLAGVDILDLQSLSARQ